MIVFYAWQYWNVGRIQSSFKGVSDLCVGLLKSSFKCIEVVRKEIG